MVRWFGWFCQAIVKVVAKANKPRTRTLRPDVPSRRLRAGAKVSHSAAHELGGQDLDVSGALFVLAVHIPTGLEGAAASTRRFVDSEVTWKASRVDAESLGGMAFARFFAS